MWSCLSAILHPWALRQGCNAGTRNASTQRSVLHYSSQKLIVSMWFVWSRNLATPKEKGLFWVSKSISTQNRIKVFTLLPLGHSLAKCCKSESLLLPAMLCLLLVSQRRSHHPFLRTLSLTTYISKIHVICTSHISIHVCDIPITDLFIFSWLKTQIKGPQALQEHAIHIWTRSQPPPNLSMIIKSGVLSSYLKKNPNPLVFKTKQGAFKINQQYV